MTRNRTWYFVHDVMFTGGLETLIIRISKYIQNKGRKPKALCKSITPFLKAQYEDAGITVYENKNWSRNGIRKLIKNDIEVLFTVRPITYYVLRYMYPKDRVIMYCVNPSPFGIRNYSESLLGKIKKELILKIAKSGINDGSILFMDDMITSAEYRDNGIEVPHKNICLLPMENTNQLKDWSNFKPDCREILAVCRADFPLKGYVVGLVKCLKKIRNNESNFHLTIISYGLDIDVLKDEIEDLDYVTLIGETSYEQLENYYLASDIYIGHGTTILDAAKRGVPTIVSTGMTMDFLTTGLFHEIPERLGSIEPDFPSGESLLITLLSMNKEQLIDNGNKDRVSFLKYYGINRYCKQILAVHSGTPHSVVLWLLFFLYGNRFRI